MKLLIVRHAIAQDKDAFAETGRPDAERPLTRAGARKMKRAAPAIADFAPNIALLCTSPLTRAVQTAKILKDFFPKSRVVVRPELKPDGSFAALHRWLRKLPPASAAALVGHEPQLSRLIGWLLTRTDESFIELKKGGACLLEFPHRVEPGQAHLLWLLKPSQLRIN